MIGQRGEGMKEVINRLLEEHFEDGKSSLDFSCTNIELSIEKGETKEGSFRIYSRQGSLTKGLVYTTDNRMECLTTQFVGNDEEIAYRFHGENVREGEEIKGEFSIISNHGEYSLPFTVQVEKKELAFSLGEVKNLFHFACLGIMNMATARTIVKPTVSITAAYAKSVPSTPNTAATALMLIVSPTHEPATDATEPQPIAGRWFFKRR